MKRTKSCLLFIPFFSASALLACGPWLPEPYLLRNDDVFYYPPEVGFGAELRHLLPGSVPHKAVFDDGEAGGASSAEELRAALKAVGIQKEKVEGIVAAFREFRSTLNEAKRALDTQPFPGYYIEHDPEEREAAISLIQALKVPQDLPEEFRFYLEGALAYYLKDTVAARRHWKALLDLPKEARQYRSVMAAFMLAKTSPDGDPASYRLVRDLAGDGFADHLGLGAASYGREAQLHLFRGEFLPAIELYLQQWASGYSNAEQSLEITAAKAWAHSYDSSFDDLVDNGAARAVLTAYLLTQHDTDEVSRYRERLLQMLPDPDKLSMEEAGRFALLEYQKDNLSAARLWLGYADPKDALALWVRSKLLLRAGKIEEGRTIMLALTESFEDSEPDWRRLDTRRAWGELGLLYMRDERYGEAADAFWKADSWQDCAYVLERLLTVDELLGWLKARPKFCEDDEADFYGGNPQALVARRLMREVRFEEALKLFSPELRLFAVNYLDSMKAAHDAGRDAEERARNFWAAAQTMRDAGLELFGAELSPDYAWMGGQFDWGDLMEERKRLQWSSGNRINSVPWDEDEMAESTRVQPNRRFHYRYRAVELAELAAGLLPNNDENAARIYVVSASWIQKRDPLQANRLFKQLVVRCPETELGKAALKKNWFPAVDLAEHQPFAE